MTTHAVYVQGRELATDGEGFLLDPADGSMDVAGQIASDMRIDMTDAHWEVVHDIRTCFEENVAVPERRTLLK